MSRRYRNNSSKRWIWVVVILILITGIWAYSSGKLNVNLSNSPSIKDLSENPSLYSGQNVTIRGTLSALRGNGLPPTTLADNEGYYIYIDADTCVWSVQRDYSYDGTKYYTAKGVFSKTTNSFGNYYLICSNPIR